MQFEGFRQFRARSTEAGENGKAISPPARRTKPKRRKKPCARPISRSRQRWFSFTAVTHPFSREYASIPVIAIGKYREQAGRLRIPIGVQVHHGLVDGIHVGEFYGVLESLCRAPDAAFR